MTVKHDLYPTAAGMGKDRKAYRKPYLSELGDLRTLTLGLSVGHGGLDMRPGEIRLPDGSILMPDGSRILPNGQIILPLK